MISKFEIRIALKPKHRKHEKGTLNLNDSRGSCSAAHSDFAERVQLTSAETEHHEAILPVVDNHQS